MSAKTETPTNWAIITRYGTVVTTGLTQAEARHFTDQLIANGRDVYAENADGNTYPA